MRLFGKVVWLISSISMIILLFGCSSGRTSDPLIPDSQTGKGSGGSIEPGLNHSLLGYYSFIIDPENNGIEIIPLRETMLHLNALRFLEPPPPFKIITSGFTFDGEKADLDVKLVHPFPGLTKYTGFDVCGIVITSGSISGFSDPDIVVAGEGDTHLINADGLTRWWNPREFPHNSSTPVFGYIDGVKGVPDSKANFSATLNGYKYFADGLSKDDSVVNIPLEKRGMFSAGASNTRHYTIDMSGGFVFNYAVDACWYPPIKEPVTGPESFSESANREEPWLVEADNETNTFWFDTATGTSGGELGLDIHCYDWFHADQNTVRVESPGNFDPITSTVPIGGNSVYSTYHVDIANPTLSSPDPITVWISAEADVGYQGILPGKPTAAYMVPFTVDVGELTPGGLIWSPEKVIDHPDRIPYNDIDPALIINGEGDILCAFFFWHNLLPDNWTNNPRFATSHDNGHNFGEVAKGGSGTYQTNYPVICSVSKCCLGSNGWAFYSYFYPGGLAFGAIPQFDPYTDANSYRYNGPDGTPVNSHDMLYTIDGYPMVFYDEYGMIQMARGTMPNIAGSGDGWPESKGTDHMIDDSGSKWLSKVRASGKTSDGICHIFYWNSSGLDYIQAASSTDTT
ncbi:MAG: hypothetical protein ABIC40_00540, partial [bacterium]